MDMGKASDQVLYTESSLLENCLRKGCGKQKNLSELNPSCEKLAGLEGQLGMVSPRSLVGSGFLCWDRVMLGAGMGAGVSREVGQEPYWTPGGFA